MWGECCRWLGMVGSSWVACADCGLCWIVLAENVLKRLQVFMDVGRVLPLDEDGWN